MMSIKPMSGSQICGKLFPNDGRRAELTVSFTRLHPSRPREARRIRISLSRNVSPHPHDISNDSLKEFFPPHPDASSAIESVTTGSLRSDHDYKRQLNFIEKAEASGHTVIRGDIDEEKRRMGISLVIMKGGLKGTEGGLMDEEIFGPVLPIIPVDVSWQFLLESEEEANV